MYCPEANCIEFNIGSKKAVVIVNRCKGCELCAIVCSTHHAITMHPVNGATGEIILDAGAGAAAGLGQAYAG
jgi:pyruvate ferredoxin oxidoreductase delta subunit